MVAPLVNIEKEIKERNTKERTKEIEKAGELGIGAERKEEL